MLPGLDILRTHFICLGVAYYTWVSATIIFDQILKFLPKGTIFKLGTLSQ